MLLKCHAEATSSRISSNVAIQTIDREAQRTAECATRLVTFQFQSRSSRSAAFQTVLVLLLATSLLGPVLTELFTPRLVEQEARAKAATI